MENHGKWMSILEYASFKQTSISTIRRHIKSKRVESKKIEGKYFIFVDEEDLINYQSEVIVQSEDNSPSKRELELELEVQRLKSRLGKQEEELNDLLMLVQVYEDQSTRKNQKATGLPKELPEIPLA